jgi:hypothetical protein
MKPDIVYLFAMGHTFWRDQELRYSLRSLEKQGENYGNIILVGDKPPYLNGKIIHIPQSDNSLHCHERRIYEKLLVACNTPEISDPFIFFNDDYFLTKPIDFSNIGYYFSINIEDKIIKRSRNDLYKKTMRNTFAVLKEKGLKTRYFDIHYPMQYYKNKFIEAMKKYDWEINAGYLIKSLYANTLRIKGEKRKDYKIKNNLSKDELKRLIILTDLFSTEKIYRNTAEYLVKKYRAKSSYEE